MPTDQVAVPNLIGLTPDEVQSALNKAGLYLRATGVADYYSGSCKATSQSIDADVMVDLGTVIEVRFADGNVLDYSGPVIND